MLETQGRRRLNRERTRAALFDAVLTLIETGGLDAVSAERVADMAGVSRRTFFNYFPGVDALVAAAAQEVVEQVATTLASRPIDEPFVDSLLAAMDEVFTVELLTVSARIWRVLDQSAAARRFALDAEAAHTEVLAHAWARERLARAGVRPDSLRESVVMATLSVAVDQARRQWIRHHTGRVDAAALEEFLALTHRAFEMVRPVAENTSDF